jgi:hypothetical protein
VRTATNWSTAANWSLTIVAITGFVAQVVFVQLSDFDYLVQTCCGDGVRTEFLSSRWWSTLIEKVPFRATQIFDWLLLLIPILSFIALSRSIIAKVALSIVALSSARNAATIFFSQTGHTADRHGCVACFDYFLVDIVFSIICLLALFGLAAWRLTPRARVGLGE